MVRKNCNIHYQKERELVKACMEYLSFKGYEVLRNNTGLFIFYGRDGRPRAVRTGVKGSPDIIACSPDGRFVAVECKAGKNKLTAYQKAFIERLKRKNAIVVVAYSVEDLERAGL
jgi:hypothetical protein